MRNVLFLLLAVFLSVQIMAQKNKFKPSDISLTWQVVENQHAGKNQFLSTFTFENKKGVIPGSGWSVYFNMPRGINVETLTAPFQVQHMNGDLHRIYPKGTTDFPKGKPVTVSFAATEWAVNFTDAPSGPYLVLDADKSKGF